MGIFRFLLAASVVVAHSSKLPGISMLDGGMAVKTFFIISGFYMQLILDSKYGRVKNGIRLFYTNRALRIYPMYLLTLAFALCFYFAATIKLHHPADRLQFWLEAIHRHDFGPLALITISQFVIFGLDITPLFSFSQAAGFHLLTHPVPPGGILAWRFNFMPHCWSIGAELLFYLVMPFFNLCKTWWLILLCFAAAASCSLVYVFVPQMAGVINYHYGPMQFFYFIIGILGYRMVYKGVLRQRSRRDWRLFCPIIVVALLTFSPWWSSTTISPMHSAMLSFGYTVLGALSIPLLFHVTKTAAWDRWIGELSYPMYLLHIPMKWVLLALVGVSTKDEATVSGVNLLLLTVFVAFAMTYFVDRPVEAFRQRRFEKKAAIEGDHRTPGSVISHSGAG